MRPWRPGWCLRDRRLTLFRVASGRRGAAVRRVQREGRAFRDRGVQGRVSRPSLEAERRGDCGGEDKGQTGGSSRAGRESLSICRLVGDRSRSRVSLACALQGSVELSLEISTLLDRGTNAVPRLSRAIM